MDNEHFEEFLRDRYHPELKHVNNRAVFYRQAYNRFQWCTIILSLLASILVVVEQSLSWFPIKIAAAITPLIVAALATIARTFNYQKKEQYYTNKFIELENEYDLYKADSGSYSKNENKERHFVERFIEIEKDMPNSVIITKKLF